MTKLEKPVTRETTRVERGRNIIITIAPCGSQNESRVGLRLKGKRTQYVASLSWLYQRMAENHAWKEKAARKVARKNGIAWKQAKKQFVKENSI